MSSAPAACHHGGVAPDQFATSTRFLPHPQRHIREDVSVPVPPLLMGVTPAGAHVADRLVAAAHPALSGRFLSERNISTNVTGVDQPLIVRLAQTFRIPVPPTAVHFATQMLLRCVGA